MKAQALLRATLGRKPVWLFIGLLLVLPFGTSTAQEKPIDARLLDSRFEALDHRIDQLAKAIDDILWYNKVGDVANIDKVYIVGPPPAKVKNPTAMGATNPVKFWSYIFIPQKIDRSKKLPLIVLPHGGVHGDFTTYHTHIIRELMAQGYVVVAPEYRGSTGYGEGFYKQIDYGGLEIEDNNAARDYMVENYDFIDGYPRRRDRLEPRRTDYSHGHFRASERLSSGLCGCACQRSRAENGVLHRRLP